jgi:hypothetical protein
MGKQQGAPSKRIIAGAGGPTILSAADDCHKLGAGAPWASLAAMIFAIA